MSNVLFGIDYDSVVQAFDIDDPKVTWVKPVGPDEVLGEIVDPSGNKYVLWGRDYMSGLKSESIELDILFGITIEKWIFPRNVKECGDLEDLDYREVVNGFSIVIAKVKSWQPNPQQLRNISTNDYYE